MPQSAQDVHLETHTQHKIADMQAELSEKQAAVVYADSQFQEQQGRYIMLQKTAEAASSEAAAAAATQMEQSAKVAQQLQADLAAAQLRGDKLQSTCDVQSKSNKYLTAELSVLNAAADNLQVSLLSCFCKCCNLACNQVGCTLKN